MHWRQNTQGIQTSSSLKVIFTQVNANTSFDSYLHAEPLQGSFTHPLSPLPLHFEGCPSQALPAAAQQILSSSSLVFRSLPPKKGKKPTWIKTLEANDNNNK